MSFEQNKITVGANQISSAYLPASAPLASDACNLYQARTGGNVVMTGTMPIIYDTSCGYAANARVTGPGFGDGFDMIAVGISAPAFDQLIHVKVHALFEYTVEGMSNGMFLGRKAEPSETLADVIAESFDMLPRMLPASYNSLGAVWRWFQDFYNKRGKAYIEPLLRGVPLVGPVAAEAVDHLMSYA